MIRGAADPSARLAGELAASNAEAKPKGDVKLDEAAREFESLVVGELLKSMRGTVPKGMSGTGGFDRDMVTSMFDEQLAKVIAETGAFGIGDIVKANMQETQSASSATASVLNDGGWVQPIDVMPTHYSPGQRFGADRPGDRTHAGLDIAKPIGTPVHAARAGTVAGIGRDPGSHGGLSVTIAHDDGSVRTRYIHLDSIDPSLTVGSKLSAGETLGTVGATGTSAHGAHLHFEVEVGGTNVDPQRYMQSWRRTGP